MEIVNNKRIYTVCLAKYLDRKMKVDIRGLTPEEITATLDKAVDIFRLIDDKDLFEQYYRANLATRLLHNKSVNDDSEREMISKLKAECGPAFTQRISTMMKDMNLS